MDLSGLSAIAPGYLQGQASQATTAINQNTAQSPAALAALLQALGIGGGQQPQGAAQLGRPLAPQPTQGPTGHITVGPLQDGPPIREQSSWPPGPNPQPGAMFMGGTFASQGGNPNPDAMFPPRSAPAPTPQAGAAAAGPPPAGQGGGAAPPPSQAAAPNLPPQTKQALYQMPLQDIVAAVKKGNPNIDNRTLGLGLQALAPFLNRQAQLDLQEQRLQFSQENAALRNDLAVQRLDNANQRMDPGYVGDVAAARRAGTISAAEEPAAREAITLIDNAVVQSANVPRDQWKFANQVLQAGEGQMNDPKLASLNAALFGVINTYARAIAGVTGRGPTVNDKKHAEAVLSSAQSQEAFKAAADQLKYEVQVAQEAAARNRSTTGGRAYTGQAPDAPAGGAAPVVIDGYMITPR